MNIKFLLLIVILFKQLLNSQLEFMTNVHDKLFLIWIESEVIHFVHIL